MSTAKLSVTDEDVDNLHNLVLSLLVEDERPAMMWLAFVQKLDATCPAPTSNKIILMLEAATQLVKERAIVVDFARVQ